MSGGAGRENSAAVLGTVACGAVTHLFEAAPVVREPARAQRGGRRGVGAALQRGQRARLRRAAAAKRRVRAAQAERAARSRGRGGGGAAPQRRRARGWDALAARAAHAPAASRRGRARKSVQSALPRLLSLRRNAGATAARHPGQRARGHRLTQPLPRRTAAGVELRRTETATRVTRHRPPGEPLPRKSDRAKPSAPGAAVAACNLQHACRARRAAVTVHAGHARRGGGVGVARRA